MSYLEQLKSENMLQGAHPKGSKGGSGGFGSTTKRLFSEKKAETDLDTLDHAEAIFNFLADRDRPCFESEIMAAVPGDPREKRNILFRLAAGGSIDYLGHGQYMIDAPRVELPLVCPLRTGGGVPRGCGFHSRLFSRMIQTGTLTIGGPCPLARVCTHTTIYEAGEI